MERLTPLHEGLCVGAFLTYTKGKFSGYKDPVLPDLFFLHTRGGEKEEDIMLTAQELVARNQSGPRADFICEERLLSLVKNAKEPTAAQLEELIGKAEEARGLSLEEVASLLAIENQEKMAKVFSAARKVKERIYGKRIVMFAPLYVSNYCINSCVYCGYHKGNKKLPRVRLTMEQVAEEVRILEEMGHKRLALEAGEDPENCPLEYILEVIKTIYNTDKDRGSIRRVNVNIAATTVEDYKRLHEAGIGTYILFQETYHRATYEKVHPTGPKSVYDWHTTAMDRAMEGGCDDVGLGVLFGLYDYRYEVLGLLAHNHHLEERFGVGCHTISVPRIRPAGGINLDNVVTHPVGEFEFKKIVAILRLAVPYTGLILSTRESPQLRDELLSLGISQVSAASSTGVGGYKAEHDGQADSTAQFSPDDHRTVDQVLESICKKGYLPSYCTACYRRGRTGEHFMEFAKTGRIQEFCQPNAILTFKEYLLDYASPQTRKLGEATIAKQLEEIKSQAMRQETINKLKRLEQGERDLYF